MKPKLFVLIISLLVVQQALATTVHVLSPPELASLFPKPIETHPSPIGFKPLTGRIEGYLILADPPGACSRIKSVISENEDFFVLADDTECLESIKAKNIADSGGYAGIIRQNSNNTLHDKESNLVHIPIIEMKPEDYDKLQDYIKKNPEARTTLTIDFKDHTQTHPINIQMWFSPTEKESYQFLFEMQQFLTEDTDIVKFTPHYVLQSQRESKNYIGCLSSGRYCPSEIEYEGRYEGKNIVEESLRQIIIWDLDHNKWWKYVSYFYSNCLTSQADIFLNTKKLDNCVENSLIMAGIDSLEVNKQFQNSFMGSRKEVDDNAYLLEERQHYVREQINSHPIVLVNKKPFEMSTVALQERICKMEGENPSYLCAASTDQLSSTHILIILSVMIAVFIAIAALYRLYIHIRMRNEIKGEVDKTLEQYYRYIATFEGENGSIGSSKKSKNKQKARELNEELQEVSTDIKEQMGGKLQEMEMAEVEGNK